MDAWGASATEMLVGLDKPRRSDSRLKPGSLSSVGVAGTRVPLSIVIVPGGAVSDGGSMSGPPFAMLDVG